MQKQGFIAPQQYCQELIQRVNRNDIWKYISLSQSLNFWIDTLITHSASGSWWLRSISKLSKTVCRLGFHFHGKTEYLHGLEHLITGGVRLILILLTFYKSTEWMKQWVNFTCNFYWNNQLQFLLTLTSHSSILRVTLQTVKICTNFRTVNEVGLPSSAANNV